MTLHARTLAIAALLTVPMGSGASLGAQVTVADEGSFTITLNGQRAGREDFWIRSTPDPRGPIFVASATTVMEKQRLEPREMTDRDGNPLGYDLKVVDGETQQFHGIIQHGRMSMTIRTPRGESSREYLVPDGSLILDDDVFHQYFFLARRQREGAVPVIIPRRNARVTLQVHAGGSESVAVGGVEVPARHLVVNEGGTPRDVWVDDAGRVLRVAIPSRGLVALRDDPPRDR